MNPNHTIFSSLRVNYTDSKFIKYDVCFDMPPRIVSDGIWANPHHGGLPSKSTLTTLELQLVAIFITTHCFHFILKRIGLPYFVSQVMAGFVLGPSLKIQSLTKYKMLLFPYGSEDILATVSAFGYLFFLFLTGVQMDFSMITRTGRKAWTIAIASLVTPVVIGFSLIHGFKGHWNATIGESDANSLDAVVLTHSSCSFAVIAALLSDLNILNSELGRLALSSALVSDVISNVVTGLGTSVMATLRDSNDPNITVSTVKSVGILFAFLLVIPIIGRPAMRWVVRNTPEGRPVLKIYTYAIILMALLLGWVALCAHLTFLAGAFVLGFVVPEGPPLGSELVKQFDLFCTWFFLPVFVTCCAMKVDVTLLQGNAKLILIVGFFVFMIHLLKMAICMGICKYCQMPKTDGLCLSLILSCKGVVDICVCIFLYDATVISSEAVAMMFISVVMLGSMARIGVKSLYDPARKYAGYQKRNVLHLKPNSELRIVACVHKPSHIIPIKKALDLCCPTTSNPIVVDVLHLMELVGRSSPIFISHRLQERVGSSDHNFSGDVIVTFDLFEHDNAGAATVNTYTAISPIRLMHEDICYLALDKLASIIILPFHVRWTDDGSVESVDDSIRFLNSKVLERAPCSVGILVKRGSSSCSNNSSSKEIAMIFLGGADDREALCLAKRTIKECTYKLVVYHLVASNSGESTNWDLMLDDEVLKDVKGYYGSVENVTYERVTIKDPSETTAFVSDIANQHHDFIIVGRRNGVKSAQTGALENWTEYSELGVIGDLLASSDTNTKASVLVVQQQQMPKS